MAKENTALAMRQNVSLQITDAESLIKVGELFDRCGMFGCSQQGQGLVLAMTCIQAGMTPLEFMQTYHIIEGKPAMRADAMLAKFVERGGKYTIEERSEKRAAATFTKENNTLKAEYTFAEAQRQGIIYGKDGKTVKTNWQKYPKQMLWARLVSDTVRALDPGVNMGTYTPEEVNDFDDAKTVRPVIPTPITGEQVRKEQPEKPAPEPNGNQPAHACQAPAAAPVTAPTGKAVEPEVMNKNFDKVPCGKLTGKKWAELSDQQLAFATTWNHPAMTEQHKLEVRKEIEKRRPAQGAQGK